MGITMQEIEDGEEGLGNQPDQRPAPRDKPAKIDRFLKKNVKRGEIREFFRTGIKNKGLLRYGRFSRSNHGPDGHFVLLETFYDGLQSFVFGNQGGKKIFILNRRAGRLS